MNFFDFAILLEDFEAEDLDKFSTPFLEDVNAQLVVIKNDILEELERRKHD